MNATLESDFFQWQDDRLILRLKVRPRASRNAWGEVIGDRIKLYLTTPPIDGKANQAVIAFVAKTFSVAKNRVGIRRGETSRDKEVIVHWPPTPKAGSSEAENLLRQALQG
ncbi:DUF167 domain-containing protein [Halothiobacillus sp.]|uniref:DUF167 domain-containing protein n=1 Tax=Halothiobacillus sp. TaxID=1891311 RepID=UPI00260D0C73|nr:DUF167 domain-containing protein [Halothiobacillus sp.]